MAAERRTRQDPGATGPSRQPVEALDPTEEPATAADAPSEGSEAGRPGSPVVGIGASAGGFVGTTGFFRDPEALQQLARQVIVPLVEAKGADDKIRVWVPSCGTGEEPYSIAMLLLEQLAAARKSCRVQIFATDVDEDAVAAARKGLYPVSISADVSPERLARYFARADEHTYKVNKQVRTMVAFGVQDPLRHAPFTHLDLICCRDLLISLEADVQEKVVALFHFALKQGGYLCLGPSEITGVPVDLFETLSKEWRIYRRIGPNRPRRVAPRSSPGRGRTGRLAAPPRRPG